MIDSLEKDDVIVFVAKTGPGGSLVSVPIPSVAAARIEAAPAELLA